MLAVEDQNLVDYTMPWRNMNYDALEYKKQIKVIKRHNQEQKQLMTPAEKMCGLRKEDRLNPAYQKMDEETANIANVMIGGRRIVAKKEEYQDDYDMCDGLKGIIEDSINEGKIEGKIEGESRERARGIQLMVESCQELGASIEAAITQLMTKYQLSRQNAGDFVKQYWR